MKTYQHIADSTKEDWDIDELINWLNESKSKGANNIYFTYYDYIELNTGFEREETEEETEKRVQYKPQNVVIKYESKTIIK